MRNDKYSKLAREKGLRARSYFKISEIDRTFKIIKKGHRILELGCWPGGWSQYIVSKGALLVGIDLKETEEMEGAEFHAQDILNFSTSESFDTILSDACTNFSGVKFYDARRNLDLIIKVLEIAETNLKRGGHLVFKWIQGPLDKSLYSRVNDKFVILRRFRPKATRDESSEIFLICRKKVK